MPATERLLAAAIVAAMLAACAGSGPPPGEPAARQEAPGDEILLQDLLARLDVLIATGDGRGAVPAPVLAEARALRVEALAAMATGDDALARDFLTAAIALFGDGTE